MTHLRTLLFPLAILAVACDSDDEAAEAEADATEERSADGEGSRHHKKFESLDVDEDGFVSLAEAQSKPKLARHFAELDLDDDGKLTKDEMAAMKRGKGKHGGWHGKDPAERAAKMMSKLDADRDGAISAAEAEGHKIAEHFATADADKDGKLTQEELVAFKSKHHRGERKGSGETLRSPVP
jgi:Ca2+-binding EF-hand superfamily protein